MCEAEHKGSKLSPLKLLKLESIVQETSPMHDKEWNDVHQNFVFVYPHWSKVSIKTLQKTHGQLSNTPILIGNPKFPDYIKKAILANKSILNCASALDTNRNNDDDDTK